MKKVAVAVFSWALVLTLAAPALAAGSRDEVMGDVPLPMTSYPLANQSKTELVCLGRLLEGAQGPAYNPDAPLVELRGVGVGNDRVIVPLGVGGVSDEVRNPLFDTTSIGTGRLPKHGFSYDPVSHVPEVVAKTMMINSNNPTYGGLFFRVYNQSTVAASTYYADSDIITFDSSKTSGEVHFSQGMKSIPTQSGDPVDSDNDGLSDEEELALGTDPLNPDTNGNGLLDSVDVAYGIDPIHPLIIELASEMVPGISSALPEGKTWTASWPVSTNSAVRYVLEFVPDLMDIQEGEFPHPAAAQRVLLTKSASDIRIDSNWHEVVDDWVRGNLIGFMRVRMEIVDDAVPPSED